jgi:tyrosine-protein kinase Etk/Wzc
MNPERPVAKTVTPARRPEIIDLRKLLGKIYARWYLFAFFVVLTIAVAYVYIRYTYPTYRVSSLILINEEENNMGSSTDALLQGFGLTPGAQNLDNQILILSSWTLISKSLEKLPFGIDYYIKGRIMSTSHYPNNPIKVMVDSTGRIPYDIEFCVRPESPMSYHLSVDKKAPFELDTVLEFWEKVEFEGTTLSLSPTEAYWDLPENLRVIHFMFYDHDKLIKSYQENLKVEKASREGTMVRVVLEGTNKAKSIDFLETLTQEFLASNLEKKNYEANRIIDFIDSQLEDIADSLMITETKLQEFRSRHRVMDISAQGQQIIEQAVRLEDEKARLMLESSYYEYLTNYLENDDSQETPIAPTSMGIDDPLLTTLMQELASQQSDYFSGGVGEKNPLQSQLALKIRNTKQSLKETLQGIVRANNMAIDENQQQIRNLNTQAAGLPRTERQLLGIERKYKLNDVLYTFLLQQQAEAQIQRASNAPDNEIVDPARADLLPVAPKKRLIYAIALLLGLGIPLFLIMVSEAFSTRITSEEELKKITGLPIVGHIPRSDKDYQTVVAKDPDDVITEAFRRLRTRMQFFTRETVSPVIQMTSSMPSEGKTYSALNLASAYSLADKKTVLVGFDLRRPKLYQDFELENTKGVSTYLIGRDSLKDVIQPTGHKNLDLISAGPIPPNPAELTDSEKMRKMFSELRRMYDFIIVDSAPIGTISDSYALSEVADVTILLVRHRYTLKRMLEATLQEARSNGVIELSILVNDIKRKRTSYRYMYNYHYNYADKGNRLS